VVVNAAYGQRRSSSSPTGASGGVQEGGVQTVSGYSVSPPPTGGHQRVLQVAAHAAVVRGRAWAVTAPPLSGAR
jgi:hypothetical protein